MALIKDIILYSRTHIVAEQNRTVITKLLSEKHLQQVHDDTWRDITIKGFKVPKEARTDKFHDNVMKSARDLQGFWEKYTSENRTVKKTEPKKGFFGKAKTVEVELPHHVMRDKFILLKKGADEWLNDNQNGDATKTKHCQALKEMAELGIREVEREMFTDMSKWLLAQTPEKTTKDPHPQPLDPSTLANDPATVQRFAERFNMRPDQAKDYLLGAVKMLQTEAKALWPEGYEQEAQGCTVNINTQIPEESRPRFNKDEAMAVQSYCVVSCYPLNAALRSDTFKNLKLDVPATQEQLALLENTMIEGLKEKYKKKLEEARLDLVKQEQKTEQSQRECPTLVNQVTEKHGRQFSRDQLAGLSNDDFIKKLTDLEVPQKLIDELALKHRIAYDRSPVICEEKRLDVLAAEQNLQNPRETKEGKEIIQYAQEFAALQTAFEKAKPFPEPVNVKRGLRFKSQAEAENYVAKLQAKKDEIFPLEGFQSTSTNDIPTTGRADKDKGELWYVKITIKARQGLDVMPYAGFQNERELLLNHGTMVGIAEPIRKKVKDGVTIWNVTLEQIVVKENKQAI